MSDSTLQEEVFSDDSLNKSLNSDVVKPKRKVKPFKKKRSKGKSSYMQLYQRRLTNEFLSISLPIISNNESSEGAKPPDNSPNVELEEQNDLHASNGKTIPNSEVKDFSQTQKPSKAKKVPSVLWSEFLTQKYKLHHSRSEVEVKVKMLKNRLEYGRRMSSVNKVNKMCLELKESSIALSKQRSDKSSSTITEKTCSSKPNVKKSRSDEETSTVKSSVKQDIEKIQKRLNLMKSRHQKDKEIVKSIRKSLSKAQSEVFDT